MSEHKVSRDDLVVMVLRLTGEMPVLGVNVFGRASATVPYEREGYAPYLKGLGVNHESALLDLIRDIANARREAIEEPQADTDEEDEEEDDDHG